MQKSRFCLQSCEALECTIRSPKVKFHLELKCNSKGYALGVQCLSPFWTGARDRDVIIFILILQWFQA